MTDTAASVIGKALHIFGIVDITEQPSASDIATGVPILNDLLRNEHVDGACQYTIGLLPVTLPQGVLGQVYQFSMGTANSAYFVQKDIVAMRQLWMNDINLTVNRETRGPVPKTDVVRTTYPGIITKWHAERQADASVLVTAWQPPRIAAQALLEVAYRVAPLTDPLGGDVVGLPPEGIHDIALLYGRRICAAYGRNLNAVAVQLQDAEAVDLRWKNWARGQQWLRMVRA